MLNLTSSLEKTIAVTYIELLYHWELIGRKQISKPRILLMPTALVGCQYIRQWDERKLQYSFLHHWL